MRQVLLKNEQECIYQVLKLDAKPRVFKSDDTLLRVFLNGFKISDIDQFILHLTNRFHVAVRLFSYRSQMTSKCGKNNEVAYEVQTSVSLMLLPHFDVLCHLLLNRPMATWNLFVLYNDQKIKRWIHIPASNRLTVLFEDLCYLGIFLSPKCYFSLCFFVFLYLNCI